MFDDYIEDYDQSCPKCNHSPLRMKDCDRIGCEDGYLDEYEDDSINFYPGEEYIECPECKGTGSIIWCPNCGEELSGHRFPEDDEDDFYDPNQLKLPL